MIHIERAARDQLLAFVAVRDEPLALRIRVASPSPLAPVYDFALVDKAEWESDDSVCDSDGLTILVDRASVPLLAGARLDWVETRSEAGFTIDNPNLGPLAPWMLTGTPSERVLRVLAERVNPAVATHGGRVELSRIENGIAYLRMSGGCQGCGKAALTLKEGVEGVVLRSVPEITAVQDETDHAAGSRPFF